MSFASGVDNDCRVCECGGRPAYSPANSAISGLSVSTVGMLAHLSLMVAKEYIEHAKINFQK